ncbi:MAG: helix-turn-helix domain-containing protein, partial [Bacteroidota bacterium]
FFQSVFLLCLYAFSRNYRERINPYVIILTGALFVGLLGKVFYISEVFGPTYKLILVSEFAGMLFGATIFLLIKASIRKMAFDRKDLLFYIPPIVYMTFVLWYFAFPSRELVAQRVERGEFYLVIYCCFALGITVNLTYWALAVRRFARFRKELAEEASYHVRLRFFTHVLIATGLVLTIWIGVYVACLIDRSLLTGLPRQLIWLSWALIVLFVAFYSITHPRVFDINPLPQKVKYAQSKLSSADLDRLKLRLDQYMEEKKPYLNGRLLKAELAEMIGLNKPDLARLLNEKIGMNFFDYVNYFRIREFIDIAKEDRAQNFTFFALAQEAGFNSKSTFNKAFKKVTGSSPTDYFRTQ